MGFLDILDKFYWMFLLLLCLYNVDLDHMLD